MVDIAKVAWDDPRVLQVSGLFDTRYPDLEFYLALARPDRPVGYVACRAWYGMLEIHLIVTSAAYEQRGVARQLLYHVMSLYPTGDVRAIGCTVEGRGFFDALGFEESYDGLDDMVLARETYKEA